MVVGNKVANCPGDKLFRQSLFRFFEQADPARMAFSPDIISPNDNLFFPKEIARSFPRDGPDRAVLPILADTCRSSSSQFNHDHLDMKWNLFRLRTGGCKEAAPGPDGRSQPGAGTAWRGRSMVKTQPLPGMLLTLRTPLFISVPRRQIANPSPTPDLSSPLCVNG
jgi:hypothetical protein